MKTLKKVLMLQGALMLIIAIAGSLKRSRLLSNQEAFLHGLLGLFFLQLAGLIKIKPKLELELDEEGS